MTIYVDKFSDHHSWGMWAGGGHMLTTDLDELHTMAKAIGLKREWFQDKRIPHYDLTKSRRAKAIKLGAVEIEFGELPNDVIRNLVIE